MLFLNAESQVIHTDQKNILIRALTLRKQKAESNSKNVKSVTSVVGSRKRYFSVSLKFIMYYTDNFIVLYYMIIFSYQFLFVCLFSFSEGYKSDKRIVFGFTEHLKCY